MKYNGHTFIIISWVEEGGGSRIPIHIYTHAVASERTDTDVRAHADACAPQARASQTCARKEVRTQMCSGRQAHAQVHTHRYTHGHVYTRIDTCKNTRTHTCAHTGIGRDIQNKQNIPKQISK